MQFDIPEYEIVIRSRGGSGKSAIWQWNVYEVGSSGSLLKTGEVKGARSKALAAARDAESSLRVKNG